MGDIERVNDGCSVGCNVVADLCCVSNGVFAGTVLGGSLLLIFCALGSGIGIGSGCTCMCMCQSMYVYVSRRFWIGCFVMLERIGGWGANARDW